ncbi:MAG TPA: acyl-CoA dehydrogenase [Candidatus Binatia bacterium]
MQLIDLDLDLSEEERSIRDTVHRFAAAVLRPAGTALDRLADPADVVTRRSILWNVFEQYRALGLHGLDSDLALAGTAHLARIHYLIQEELGWGDTGLAISLGVADFPAMFARLVGRDDLVERFANPAKPEIGCWAVTEPNHGSDELAFNQPVFDDRKVRADCIATPMGDDFVINGQKSAWVSNGTIATTAALFCTLDSGHGLRGGGVALVPLDLPGVSRGTPLDKLGQRALNQGEIYFDSVRIPAEWMIIGEENYAMAVEAVLTMANAHMGTTFVGLARAAFEHAIEYAQTRVQGGLPIARHQNVKLKLFDMFRRVEAARALARRVFVYNATQQPALLPYSIASKTFCTDAAYECAHHAVQIFGGNGLSREYPVEKLLRDARAALIEDGCNDMLSIVGADRLDAAMCA